MVANKTTKQTDAPLRLNRLEISDFLRIEALRIDAQGKHILITGPNGSGKTSAVDAIWAALGGKSQRDMPEPVRHGADRADLKVDLGEIKIERVYDAKGKTTKLVVTKADGSKIARPQELLNTLFGLGLDPVAFLSERPQDQVDNVLRVCGVKAPVERVQELTGEQHQSLPNESAYGYLTRLSADDTGIYYVRRREANRISDQKKKALLEQGQALDTVGGPPAMDEEQAASASHLLAKLEALNRQADERRQAEAKAEAGQRQLGDAEEQLEDLRGQLAQRELGIDDIEAQIKALTAMGQELAEQVNDLAGRIGLGLQVVQDFRKDADTLTAAAQAIGDPARQIAEVRVKIQDVEKVNAKLSKRRHAAEEFDRLQAETEEAQAGYDHQDKILSDLRYLRSHLLEGVDLGVPGLEVGDGELRLRGVPFRQASQAEQIRVACAVAMRQGPRLKLLRVDDGEHLDRKSRELLFAMADQHDWQVIFTAVADQESLKVEIVHGDR